MYDAFSKAGGANVRRRQGNGSSMHFSPSYGVRNGFIKDPNWPPAQLPDEGAAAQRRHLRVKCSFKVRVPGGKPMETGGDISAGGAKFALTGAIGSDVEVLAGGVCARATVLQVLKGGGMFTYRVKFLDAAAGDELFESVYFS